MSPRRNTRIWILVLLVVGPVLLEGGLSAVVYWRGSQRGVRYHEDYGWKPYANVSREGAMWGRDRPAKSNSAGWRDRERTRVPAPKILRIAAIGDSFTFGVGVDDGERFTDVMEAMQPGVEVLNFGMNGFGTDQELEVLRHEALDYSPSIVLCMTYLGNDLLDITHSLRHRWPKPRYVLDGGELRLELANASPLVRLRSATYIGEALALVVRRLGFEKSQVQEACADPVALYLALVERMREHCDASAAHFVIALVHEPDIDPVIAEAVRVGLEGRGIRVIDLRPSFIAGMGGGEELFNPPPVSHWNVAGHRLVAQELLRGFRALELVP